MFSSCKGDFKGNKIWLTDITLFSFQWKDVWVPCKLAPKWSSSVAVPRDWSVSITWMSTSHVFAGDRLERMRKPKVSVSHRAFLLIPPKILPSFKQASMKGSVQVIQWNVLGFKECILWWLTVDDLLSLFQKYDLVQKHEKAAFVYGLFTHISLH